MVRFIKRVIAFLPIALAVASANAQESSRGDEDGLSSDSWVPKLSLRGFADFDYAYSPTRDVDGNLVNEGFRIGQIDFFINSALSSQFSVLTELVFEFFDDGGFGPDLERLELRYTPFDFFNISIGRTHTRLGYWNPTFHHGAWFQTTIERPDTVSFEDESGLLPIHSIGIELFGKTSLGGLGFFYSAMVANGRGLIVDDISNAGDRHPFKAINLFLGLSHNAVPGLTLGGNFYIDKIPANPAAEGRNGTMDEYVFGAHAVYLRHHIELLAEFMFVKHNDNASLKHFDTMGGYVQAAYELPWFKPYYRFDILKWASDDPFFRSKGGNEANPFRVEELEDVIRHTAGVRFDPMTWVGIKLEYSGSGPGPIQTHSIAAQAAFTY